MRLAIGDLEKHIRDWSLGPILPASHKKVAVQFAVLKIKNLERGICKCLTQTENDAFRSVRRSILQNMVVPFAVHHRLEIGIFQLWEIFRDDIRRHHDLHGSQTKMRKQAACENCNRRPKDFFIQP